MFSGHLKNRLKNNAVPNPPKSIGAKRRLLYRDNTQIQGKRINIFLSNIYPVLFVYLTYKPRVSSQKNSTSDMDIYLSFQVKDEGQMAQLMVQMILMDLVGVYYIDNFGSNSTLLTNFCSTHFLSRLYCTLSVKYRCGCGGE